MTAFSFSEWAMPVVSRPHAALAVVLHRLQRMTVWPGGRLHRAIREWECTAFARATGSVR